MSLFPIGAQPIDFDSSPLAVACADPNLPLLMETGDTLLFQLGIGCCENAPNITEPEFASGWNEAGRWSVVEGQAASTDGNNFASIEWPSFAPTEGELYCLQIAFDQIGGQGVAVSFGGQQWEVGQAGLWSVTFVATGTDILNIQLLGPGSSVVMSSAQVFDGPQGITMDLVECGTDDVLFTANLASNPQYFQVAGNVLKVTVPMEDTDIEEGCFTVRMTYTCGEESTDITSSTVVKVDDEACRQTLKVRVCNDTDKMNVAAGYFEMRIASSLVRPRWNITIQEYTRSDGRIVRTLGDRKTLWELWVEKVGYSHHQFLSSLALWDHIYLQGVEWAPVAQDYVPLYSDNLTTEGAVIIPLRPRQELLRAEQCGQIGEGCDPANDPVCRELNFILGGPDQVGTDLFARLVIFDELGFTPGNINWSIDGVAQTAVTYTGVGTYQLGPVQQGDTVAIAIEDQSEEGCFATGSFVVPCVNSVTFIVGSGDDIAVEGLTFRTNTPVSNPNGAFAKVREPDGTITDFGGAGIDVTYFPNQEGPYCFWPSTVPFLQPNTQFTRLEFRGDYWLAVDLSATAGHQVARMVFTNVPNLATVTFAPFPASLLYLDVSGLVLTQAQVDAILVEMDALATNNGTLIIDGAGNAAPSGAGTTAAAALISRGWTVNTN